MYKGADNFFHLVITDSYGLVLTYLVGLLKAKYVPFLKTYHAFHVHRSDTFLLFVDKYTFYNPCKNLYSNVSLEE